MGDSVRVLIIEDNPADVGLIQLALDGDPNGSFATYHVPLLAAGLKRLAQAEVDVVLLDLGLPDSRGMEGLGRIREKAPNVPVVVLTGAEDRELVRRAMEAGAEDYQVKGLFPPGLLGRILRTAIHRRWLEERLKTDQLPDAALLSTLADLGEGLALIDGQRLSVINHAFTELTNWSRSDLSEVPGWLMRVLRAAGKAEPPAGTYLVEPTYPGSTSGMLTLVRKDGTPVRVEYAFRPVRGKKTRHIVFWIHEARSRGRSSDGSSQGLTFEPD